VRDQRNRNLLDDLHAFFQEHQYCGDLDGGVEGDRRLDDVYVQVTRASDLAVSERPG
jgi:hypothetical protein